MERIQTIRQAKGWLTYLLRTKRAEILLHQMHDAFKQGQPQDAGPYWENVLKNEATIQQYRFCTEKLDRIRPTSRPWLESAITPFRETLGEFICHFPHSVDPLYVVYASREPVQGIRELEEASEKELEELQYGLDGWGVVLLSALEQYADILMCMRSIDMPQTPYYNNRGICRSLYSFFQGGQRGLSIKLHGFSAVVMKKMNPTKKFLTVAPLPSMLKILKNKLQKDAIREPNQEERRNFFPRIDSAGVRDTPIVIEIDALMKCAEWQ